jgi:DNA-binding NarL/FixJ family response regulator
MNVNCYIEQRPIPIPEQPVAIYVNKALQGVLIVDDSPLIVKSIKELLEDIAGITSIESCGMYSEAINLLSTFNPAVVLLDVNLPDKNGIVLLKYLRTFYPEIIVIMVTNQNEVFYKNICLELGAHSFLDKSNDFEKLLALVSSVIK